MSHEIDCHILTLPDDDFRWADELRRDLDGEPVTQHWMPGIEGQLGAARAEGFAQGMAPYVTFADPDDRIIPGTYQALMQALRDHPSAPFAWAGSQKVSAVLDPIGPPFVHDSVYDPRRHRNSMVYVHQPVLYRRSTVMPALDLLRQAGNGADWLLSVHIAQPHIALPQSHRPVHVPIIGSLWRQHARGYHNRYDARANQSIRALAGVTPQYLRVIRQAKAAADHAPSGCMGCGRPTPP